MSSVQARALVHPSTADACQHLRTCARELTFTRVLSIAVLQMAQLYGLPRTPTPSCTPGKHTTVGWIPAQSSESGAESAGNAEPPPRVPIIPRLVLQTWKTSSLDERVCNAAVMWSKINPEFDYMLFNGQ